MNNEIIEYIQDKYENILSDHWHKLHQIRELVDTDNGSALRQKSINDRRSELNTILSEKELFEKHFDDIELTIPKWYINWIQKLHRYEDPFYRKN